MSKFGIFANSHEVRNTVAIVTKRLLDKIVHIKLSTAPHKFTRVAENSNKTKFDKTYTHTHARLKKNMVQMKIVFRAEFSKKKAQEKERKQITHHHRHHLSFQSSFSRQNRRLS